MFDIWALSHLKWCLGTFFLAKPNDTLSIKCQLWQLWLLLGPNHLVPALMNAYLTYRYLVYTIIVLSILYNVYIKISDHRTSSAVEKWPLWILLVPKVAIWIVVKIIKYFKNNEVNEENTIAIYGHFGTKIVLQHTYYPCIFPGTFIIDILCIKHGK